MGADPLSAQDLRGACLEREAGGARREAGAIEGQAPGLGQAQAPGLGVSVSARG